MFRTPVSFLQHNDVRAAYPQIAIPHDPSAEGFVLAQARKNNRIDWVVAGGSDRGALYGVYQKAADGFAEKYFAMLSAGGTKHHTELLAPFGLDARDPAFWQIGQRASCACRRCWILTTRSARRTVVAWSGLIRSADRSCNSARYSRPQLHSQSAAVVASVGVLLWGQSLQLVLRLRVGIPGPLSFLGTFALSLGVEVRGG